MLNIFHIPVGHLYVSGELSIQSVAHFFKLGYLYFTFIFCYGVVGIPYIFCTLTPYQMYGLLILKKKDSKCG